MNKNKKDKSVEYDAVDYDPFAEPTSITVPTTEPQREVFASVKFGGKPASCAYNESVSLVMNGDFNTSIFISSVQKLIEKHEALFL